MPVIYFDAEFEQFVCQALLFNLHLNCLLMVARGELRKIPRAAQKAPSSRALSRSAKRATDRKEKKSAREREKRVNSKAWSFSQVFQRREQERLWALKRFLCGTVYISFSAFVLFCYLFIFTFFLRRR